MVTTADPTAILDIIPQRFDLILIVGVDIYQFWEEIGVPFDHLVDIAVNSQLWPWDVFSFPVAVDLNEGLLGNESILFQFDQLVIELLASIGEGIRDHKGCSHVDRLKNIP